MYIPKMMEQNRYKIRNEFLNRRIQGKIRSGFLQMPYDIT